MPKLPRISGAEVVRALRHLGFEQLRQSGCHVIMRRESKIDSETNMPHWVIVLPELNRPG